MDIELNLAGESIRETGPLEPLCVDPETTTRQGLKLLKDRARGELLVCRGQTLVGIFTERDALRLLAAGNDLDGPIENVMVPNPLTLRADVTLDTAIVRMSSNGYRRLPIVDAQGRPTGLINVAGIVHWLVEQFPKAVYNLPPVSKPATQEREGP